MSLKVNDSVRDEHGNPFTVTGLTGGSIDERNLKRDGSLIFSCCDDFTMNKTNLFTGTNAWRHPCDRCGRLLEAMTSLVSPVSYCEDADLPTIKVPSSFHYPNVSDQGSLTVFPKNTIAVFPGLK